MFILRKATQSRPINRLNHGFFMLAVIALFFVLIVLSSLVMSKFGQSAEQMVLLHRYHQLQQAALSGLEVVKLQLSQAPKLCREPDFDLSAVELPGFTATIECSQLNDTVFDLKITAKLIDRTTFPLSVTSSTHFQLKATQLTKVDL